MSDPSESGPLRPEGAADDPSSSTGTSGSGSLGRSLRDWWRGVTKGRNNDVDAALRDSLEELIASPEPEQAPVEADQREMLVNLLKFRTLTAEDVMVPRVDIVAVDAETGLQDLVSLLNRTYHSRLPVYRETLDDVIGMVHIKDILAAYPSQGRFSLRKMVRPVLFVAPSMRGVDLLFEMQRTRVHMALVVDEYGGIDGLITIEDLVEEIVGEIEDEFDEVEETKLTVEPDRTLRADARTTIEEFEQIVGPVVSDEERAANDTLGGLVFSLAGRVPSRGELVAHPSGIEFEVLDADPRRIRRLRVRNLPQLSAPPPEDT